MPLGARKMTKVNLHGALGQAIGESWEFEISSVAEAFRAIEANSKKIKKWLLDNSEEFEYIIYVNKNPISYREKPTIEKPETILESEIFVEFNKEKLESIDVVPVIIGAGDAGKTIVQFAVGAISIVIGVFAFAIPGLGPILGTALIVGGIGLIAAGVATLLSKPPPSVPFVAQQTDPIEGDIGGPTSYLFNGPVNTVGEGGPVPVGYGTLIVGGNNVFGNYDIVYRGYLRSTDPLTLQNVLTGTTSYVFNSQGNLISQTPVFLEPNN